MRSTPGALVATLASVFRCSFLIPTPSFHLRTFRPDSKRLLVLSIDLLNRSVAIEVDYTSVAVIYD